MKKPEIVTALETVPSSSSKSMTPFDLAVQVINQIPEDFWKNPNIRILDPCCGTGIFLLVCYLKLLQYHPKEHIINKMLFGADISQRQILITKKLLFRVSGIDVPDNHIMVLDSLSFDWDMKFDLVVGNPPYNDKFNSGNSLWGKFIDKSDNELLVDGGYSAFVCPGRWVLPGQTSGINGRIWDKIIKPYNVITINHGECSKYFNAGSDQDYFSFFVYSKTPNKKRTRIITRKDNFFIDTSRYEWIPYKNLTPESLEICKKINDSQKNYFDFKWKYENRKKQLKESMDSVFCHPVFVGNKNEVPVLKYSDVPVSEQESKKVLIKLGRFLSYDQRLYIDYDGNVGYNSSYIAKLYNHENVDYLKSDLYKFLAHCLFNGSELTAECLRKFPRLPVLSASRTNNDIMLENGLTDKKNSEEYIKSVITSLS